MVTSAVVWRSGPGGALVELRLSSAVLCYLTESPPQQLSVSSWCRTNLPTIMSHWGDCRMPQKSLFSQLHNSSSILLVSRYIVNVFCPAITSGNDQPIIPIILLIMLGRIKATQHPTCVSLHLYTCRSSTWHSVQYLFNIEGIKGSEKCNRSQVRIKRKVTWPLSLRSIKQPIVFSRAPNTGREERKHRLGHPH